MLNPLIPNSHIVTWQLINSAVQCLCCITTLFAAIPYTTRVNSGIDDVVQRVHHTAVSVMSNVSTTTLDKLSSYIEDRESMSFRHGAVQTWVLYTCNPGNLL